MRRATWILWLMLALLPLRSWAGVSMALPQAGQGIGAMKSTASDQTDQASPAHHAASADASRSSTPPCHQANAQQGDGVAGSGSNAPTCQACDWCHAALGLAPQSVTASVPPPAVAPAVRDARDTGRAAPSGLDRPPRSFLA